MKRYEKYKDSGVEWLGEIPEHWGNTSIKNVLEIPITDGPHTTPDLIDEGIPFISAEAIKNGKIDFNRKRGNISESDYELFSKKYVPKLNDIYMVKSGATTGNVAKLVDDVKFTIWSPLAVFRADGNKVIPDFLHLYLQSSNLRNAVEISWSYGTQQNIGMGVLGNLNIPIPTLSEQNKIVDYLEFHTALIEEIVSEMQKQIELLQEKRKALINEVVTKGLNPQAPMRDSGIEWLGMIPEHWKCLSLRYIVDILTDFTANGSFGDLAKNVTYLEDGYSRLVRLKDLRENLNNKGIYVSKESHEYLSKSSLYGNEILLANVGAYAGLACLMPEIDYPATLGPNMFLLKFNEHVNRKFIYYALLSSYLSGQLINKAVSSAQPKLNKEDVRSCLVILPTLSEQIAIVNHIESRTTKIDQTVEELRMQIEKLKEYKLSVISEAVTGKVDVREWKA